jgi:serine/threonine protein kinase/Leucine-rich repeat (LRR) protein
MAASRLAIFLDLVRASQLLDPTQLEELSRGPLVQAADPVPLAQHLVQRGWLTRYQITEIIQGRGKGLVLGPYRLLEMLGEGAMGQVLKAEHRAMNRLVALKVIRKEWLANDTAIRRFHREVQAASQLVHPHIVLAYDAGQVGSTHYFAMEYVDGVDLARLVKESGPLHTGAACEFVRQTALGLQHAFEHGLVHRDIKPHNLMVVNSRGGGSSDPPMFAPHVKILDFGVARLLGEEGREHALTQTGTVVGTPDFIAPEQALNPRSADIRSDLYSLGCTLYYLLAGRAPYRAGSLAAVLLKHQLEEAEPIQNVRPDLPGPVAAIVRKLMAKRPEDRYATPSEAASALAPFSKARSGQPVIVLKQRASEASAKESDWETESVLMDGKRGTGILVPAERGAAAVSSSAKKRSLQEARPAAQTGSHFPWVPVVGAASILGGLSLALVIIFSSQQPASNPGSNRIVQTGDNSREDRSRNRSNVPDSPRSPQRPLIEPPKPPKAEQSGQAGPLITPPKKDPAPVPIPASPPQTPSPIVASRQAAEWAITRNASVEVEQRGQRTVASKLEALPRQPFDVVSVVFPTRDNRQVSDDELRFIEPLRHLTKLSLWATGISDPGLEHLRNLTSLQVLDLGATAVSDAGLEHLAKLKGLRVLTLNSTGISGSGLQHLTSSRGLEILLMHATKVTDDDLGSIQYFSQLQCLDLGSTRITDEGLEKLKGLRNLKQLLIAGTQVSGAGLEHLSEMPNLEVLVLDLAPVTDEGLAHLNHMPQLKGLQLAYTRITDAGLGRLRQFHNLVHLRLSRTDISDAGLPQLNELFNLEVLQLDETKISDAGLESLKALKKLRVLDVRKTQVTAAGLRRLKTALPHCKAQR